MNLTEKDFPILDALGREVITTQRELADHAGISLGQVNYVIKNLLERGFVKIGNFTKSPKKISYVYRLTPKGLEAKSTLAAKFVTSKLKEYHNIQDRLAGRLTVFANQKRFRVFFVGPSVVGDLIDSVIVEKKLSLILAGQCKAFEDLTDYDADFFDVVLLFEGNGRKMKEAAEAVKVPLQKLTPFW
jgi:EPS-associated MarR family transcriptional regulator